MADCKHMNTRATYLAYGQIGRCVECQDPVHLNYKEFTGSIQWSEEDDCWWGKIMGTTDSVSYDGGTLVETLLAFAEAVEDWLSVHKLLCGVLPENAVVVEGVT